MTFRKRSGRKKRRNCFGICNGQPDIPFDSLKCLLIVQSAQRNAYRGHRNETRVTVSLRFHYKFVKTCIEGLKNGRQRDMLYLILKNL